MTLTTDTLAEHPDRVNYSNGMLLDATTFQDEQSYHRARLAQSLLWLHGPGTVGGLNLVYTKTQADGDNPETEELKIEPGLAIDCLGRTIYVPEPYCLNLHAWIDDRMHSDPSAMNRAIYDDPFK